MINNFEKNKRIWLLVSVLALGAACIGVFVQNIYSKVVSSNILPGVVSQDSITIIIALLLLIFSLRINKDDTKKQIVLLSFIAYLFYAYAIYVIEQIYNPLYILYVAIFALSFWSLVFSLINLNQKTIKGLRLPKIIKYLTIGFLIFIPLLFYMLWIGELIPLMRTGDKIEFAFSVYILDMVFVLPAFLISAFLLIKNKSLGYIFAPVMFFKAFTLLFSVGLGSLLKPLYNMPIDHNQSIFYIILSIIFLVLAVVNYLKLEFPKQSRGV